MPLNYHETQTNFQNYAKVIRMTLKSSMNIELKVVKI